MADIVLSVGGNVTELNNALDAALSRPRSVRGINAQSFTEPLGRITGKASEFQKSLEASNARVIAFGASAGAIFAVKSAFDTLVRATIDVEKSINSISTILGSSGSSLKAFSNDLFAVASQTGTSFKDASAAAQEFARQGLTASETILRTRDALILARISGMDFADAAKSITTAINAFASEALTSTDIINRLIAADTNFAVSAGDLAQALSRVGSSSEDANVSLNETISLVTSAAQITGRSGSVIGNAFKSIFTRLQRPQVLEDLEKIGILTRNAAGESLPLISVLRNLAGAYDSLAPGQKSFVAETVGGIYQINTLKAVLGDLGSGFSVYDSALKTVTNSTGSAIARNEQLNQTISSRLNETLNTLVKTASKVGDLTIAPTLGGGLSGITSFLEGISKTLDSEGIGGDLARGILKGIGGILSGPGLQFLTFTFLKLFQNLTTFAAKAVADFSGMNSKAKQLELTQVQVLMAMAEQPGIMQQVRNGTMSVEQASRQVFGNILAQNNAMQAQLALARLIAQAGTGAGLTVAPPKYRVTAAGYIPNFNSDFAMEEAQAKSLGARNPKARFGKGRIGGQPFIMNSEETEIPNFGKNGDSAVIPHYSKGFVPNFAKIKRSGTEIANSRSFSTLISGKFANGIDSFTANYNLLRLPYSNEDLEKEAAATKKTKGRLTEERAKTHLGKGALDLNAIDPTSPFDLKKGSSFYEVRGRKSIGATALLAKAARYKAQLGDGLKPVEFDAPPRKQEVDLGTFNVIGLSNSKVASEFLSAASGHIPNFADLRFKKSFDKEFGITRLTGISGKDIVGDIEYSGKGTREIEAFDINEKYRGKGLAKQFYGAMGKGKIKGTLLPNYDKDGNVFFPQLSRANSAKSASVTHYGPMEDFSKITVEQFQQLIAKNKSDKSFWKKNSFDLNTSHARGHIPNFASMAGLEVENPRNKMIARAMRQGSPQTARAKAAAEFEKISAEFLKATLEKYQGTKVLSSFSTSLLSGVGTGMSGGKSFAGYDVITKLITENPELAEKLGIKTGTISRIATSVKGGSGENLRIGELEQQMATGNILLERLGSKRPLAQVLAVRKGNLPDFVGKSLAGGHIPNFASQNAIDAMKRMASYTGKDPTIIAQANVAKTKLSQLTSLGDVDKLFLSQNRDSILAGMGRGAGQSSKLEALELGDLAYASAEGLPANIAEALAKIVKKTGGKAAIQSLLKGGSFANGFVPNFSALKKAVNREMSAGYSSSQIRVGTDSSLVSDSNPSGMGVYNSTEGSLGNGIGLARKAGINPKTKGMAAGHIPNFADMGTSMGLGMTQFLLALPQLQSAFEKLRGSALTTSAELAQAKIALVNNRNQVIAQTSAVNSNRVAMSNARRAYVAERDAQRASPTPVTPADTARLQGLVQDRLRAQADYQGSRVALNQSLSEGGRLQTSIRASENPTRMQRAFGQNTGYAESRAGKVQSMGMGIGMGASMVGSMAEQAVGGSTGKALGMLGESAGTAGQILSTIPGPAGYVIAGFVMIKGALDALDKGMYGFAEELKKSADIKLDELQKVNNAANELAQTLNSYQTVLDNSSSTTAETATAARKYNESLAKLAAAGDKDLMTKLAGAASSKEKQAVLAEAGEKRAAETAKQNVYKSTADLAEKRSIGREQSFGSGAGKALGGAAAGAAAGALVGSVVPVIGTAIGAGVGAIVGAVAGVTQTLMSASNARGSIFDEKNAKEGGGIGLLSSLTQGAISSGEKGSKGQQEYLTEVAAKLKLSKEEINLLKQNANLTQDFANAQEKLSLVQDSRIGGLRTEQQALERLSSSLKNSQNSLKNFAGTMSMISAQSVAGRMRLGAKASVADAQMNAARSLAPEIEGSDSRAIKEVQAAMSVLKTESSAAFKNIDADLTGGFIGELMDPLKQARSGAASAGLGSQNLNTSTAAFNNTAKAMDEVVKGFEKSGGFGKSNPQEVLSGLRAAINQKAEGVGGTTGTNLKALGLNLTGEKVQELIAQKNNTLQEKTIEELQKIGQTALEQKNKLSELKNQKVLGAFGGLGSFMQDFGMGKRAETRRAISETRSGIGEVQGRGSINLMKLLSQDMQLSGSDPRMKALKEKGVQARTSDIMKSSKIYEQAGFGKLSNADARYIAEKQVTKEVDNKTIEELSAEEVEISKETNKILADLSAKTGVKVTESNMMDPSFFSKTQKNMSSVQDSQSANAMTAATTELSGIKAELAALTNQLTTIKATIQGEIEFTIKNTAEGKNFESIQKALQAIQEKLLAGDAKTAAPKDPVTAGKVGQGGGAGTAPGQMPGWSR